MSLFRILFSSIGRVCVSFIFILSGIGKIIDFDQSLQNLSEQIIVLPRAYAAFPWLDEWIMELSGQAPLLLGVAATIEILGGMLLLLGWKARLGATLLAIFLIPTTLVFHHFWDLQGPDRSLQMAMLLKNLSILGGLLYIAATPRNCSVASKPATPNA